MHNYVVKNFTKSLAIFSFIIIFFASPAFSEETDNATELINEAEQYLLKGEYRKSIIIYDNILEIFPADSKIYEMKGIALSNIRLQSTLGSQEIENPSSMYDILYTNKLSMIEFYKALEINPTSVISLNGLGIGFGNFGEYDEAKKYFERALEIEPDNFVTKNYLGYIEKTIKKYPTNQTEKPPFLLKLEKNEIPYWIKTNAGWWASDKISDNDFIAGIQYLVKNKIIRLDSETVEKNSSNIIPAWIKNNAKWWSAGKISDEDFLSGIKYLIENSVIKVNAPTNSELVQKELERKAWNFEQYLKDIQNDIKNKNRYVENINPSEYVIVKYWKDYHKWNLEQFINKPEIFPDRNVWIDQETDRYVIEYKIYINEQPLGLPIDHVSTLKNSFSFWEKHEFNTTDGKKAVVNFDTTGTKGDANVWVTWVVRNLGEDVLGHATLGKGVVEVAIGSYGCDGSFQLFGADTVEYIMTHELGHSISFGHSANPESMMYPSISNTDYAYCLLN